MLAGHAEAGLSPQELFIHESDLNVTPILPSGKADRAASRFEAKALGFAPLSPKSWLSASPEDLTEHLAAVEKALGLHPRSRGGRGGGGRGGGDDSRARNHVLAYLHSVCMTDDVANVVANSPLFAALASSYKVMPEHCRERVTGVVGLIARQATVIEDAVGMAGILSSLSEALRNYFRNVSLKQALVAALGEVLFYVASQAVSSAVALPDHWRVPNVVYKVLYKCLGPDEDPTVHLHAVRTIDNVASVLGEHAAVMATNAVSLQLWTICFHSKSSALRRSCVSAIARLGHIQPPIIQHIADKGALPVLIELLADHSVRLRQAVVTLLLGAFSGDMPQARVQVSLADSRAFVKRVMRHMELAPPILK